jgi:thiosulfate reductase cytochrome b subunit
MTGPGVLSETLASMAIVGQIAAWVLISILVLYLFISEFLDIIGRLEIIERKWPKLWGLLNNRPMRLVLII